MNEINHNVSRRDLRIFSVVLAAVLAWIGYRWQAGAAALWTGAGLALVVGLAAPGAMRWVYLALSYATFPIGFVVSHVILAVIWYGVFTPMGLIMRLFGYDPMRRRWDRRATTYWVEHDPGGESSRYFRQF